MKTSIQIVVVGSINMDLIVKIPRFPSEGETITGKEFLTAFGGKGANQAVAVARLGAKVTFIGAVGNDNFGKQLVAGLKKEHINTKYIQTIPKVHSGTALISIDDRAHNQIIVIPGANHALSDNHMSHTFQNLRHSQAVLLQLEIPTKQVMEAALLAKKRNMLVVLNPAPASPIPDQLLQIVDYLIPNEHEARRLTGEDDIKKAAKLLLKKGAKNVIITLGDQGALLVNNKMQHIPPYKVSAIDPTAAGDAFVAGFTIALLSRKTQFEAISFANAVGGLATTTIGAQPSLPSLSTVMQFISSHKK